MSSNTSNGRSAAGVWCNFKILEMARYMRILRFQYGISTRELAKAAGVSQQYLSNIELGRYNCKLTAKHLTMMQNAFEKVIKQRAEQVRELSETYAANRNRLLDLVMEDVNDL